MQIDCNRLTLHKLITAITPFMNCHLFFFPLAITSNKLIQILTTPCYVKYLVWRCKSCHLIEPDPLACKKRLMDRVKHIKRAWLAFSWAVFGLRFLGPVGLSWFSVGGSSCFTSTSWRPCCADPGWGIPGLSGVPSGVEGAGDPPRAVGLEAPGWLPSWSCVSARPRLFSCMLHFLAESNFSEVGVSGICCFNSGMGAATLGAAADLAAVHGTRAVGLPGAGGCCPGLMEASAWIPVPSWVGAFWVSSIPSVEGFVCPFCPSTVGVFPLTTLLLMTVTFLVLGALTFSWDVSRGTDPDRRMRLFGVSSASWRAWVFSRSPGCVSSWLAPPAEKDVIGETMKSTEKWRETHMGNLQDVDSVACVHMLVST